MSNQPQVQSSSPEATPAIETPAIASEFRGGSSDNLGWWATGAFPALSWGHCVILMLSMAVLAFGFAAMRTQSDAARLAREVSRVEKAYAALSKDRDFVESCLNITRAKRDALAKDFEQMRDLAKKERGELNSLLSSSRSLANASKIAYSAAKKDLAEARERIDELEKAVSNERFTAVCADGDRKVLAKELEALKADLAAKLAGEAAAQPVSTEVVASAEVQPRRWYYLWLK